MIQETVLGGLVKVLLDRLIPKRLETGARNKQALGRMLMRLYAILDAYVNQSEQATEIIDRWDGPSAEPERQLWRAVKHLTNLTEEFGSLLCEIEFLELFDNELLYSLRSAAILELANVPSLPAEYRHQGGYKKVGLIEAAELIGFQQKPGQRILFYYAVTDDATDVTVRTMEPRVFAINEVGGRAALRALLDECRPALEESKERISSFLRDNFNAWELFPVRDAIHAR